jgi:hypothetical protein
MICSFVSTADGIRCERCGHELAGNRTRVFRACDAAPKEAQSLLKKAANFAAAAAQHVAAGAPMASEAEVARRHDICTACPHFDGKACGLCGCPVSRERSLISKLSWADQKCPDDPPRWNPVEG